MIRFSLLLPFALAGFIAPPARAQTLTGFAKFPAQSFVAGPTSGQKIEVKDGLIALPFINKQPIQGFSSLARIKGDEFWALEDNGFGSKANSADSLLRLVRLKLSFKTRKNRSEGEAGAVQLVSSLILSDPNRRAGFDLVRADRMLTGADFDPESLVVARDSSFWMGDEFGPFMLHFSRAGELLDSPFALSGVASPDDPLHRTANIKSSRGFEGLAAQRDGKALFGLLEGALEGQDPQQLPLYQFNVSEGNVKTSGAQAGFAGAAPLAFYPLEASGPGEKPHSVGELTGFGEGQFLAIERDSLDGEAARFKRIYAWNARTGAKKLVVDLLQIADKDGLAGAKMSVYRMQFQTIESVAVLDRRHLLVCNDNNFPFGRGRDAGAIEATEFALIELAAPLF